MHAHFNLQQPTLGISTTLFLFAAIACMALTIQPDTNSVMWSTALSLDLLLTIPLAYFLLIRKTNVPPTTVVPVMLIGMGLGFALLPSEQQGALQIFKSYALPVIELAVLIYILNKVRATVKKLRELREGQNDFVDIFRRACLGVLPAALIRPFTTEIAVLYYAFVAWRKPLLHANQFSYHKSSGSRALMGLLLIAIAVETVALHVLLNIWSPLAAWVFTTLSLYSAVQVIAIIKSIARRPIEIGKTHLHLRYGLLREAEVKLDSITSIELNTRIPQATQTAGIAAIKLAPLGDLEQHNLILQLKKPATLVGMYGLAKKNATTILLRVDAPAEFKTRLEWHLRLCDDPQAQC